MISGKEFSKRHRKMGFPAIKIHHKINKKEYRERDENKKAVKEAVGSKTCT